MEKLGGLGWGVNSCSSLKKGLFNGVIKYMIICVYIYTYALQELIKIACSKSLNFDPRSVATDTFYVFLLRVHLAGEPD